MGDRPLAYFLSWRTYAGRLPGDTRGWVDRRNNRYGTPYRPPNKPLESYARDAQAQPPYRMRSEARAVVTYAVEAECKHRGWKLHALNVRTNHVHCVVTVHGVKPEKAMQQLKAYATRALRRTGLAGKNQRVWAHHATTRYVWDRTRLDEACMYVLDGQDHPTSEL